MEQGSRSSMGRQTTLGPGVGACHCIHHGIAYLLSLPTVPPQMSVMNIIW
jgi:hypothetical protein